MKIKHAEWEAVVVPERGDRWPVVTDDSTGLDMDPDEINVGFAVSDGGAVTLLPPDVYGALVFEGRATGGRGAWERVPIDAMPDWVETAVGLATKTLGITSYAKGERHDRRASLRSV